MTPPYFLPHKSDPSLEGIIWWSGLASTLTIDRPSLCHRTWRSISYCSPITSTRDAFVFLIMWSRSSISVFYTQKEKNNSDVVLSPPGGFFPASILLISLSGWRSYIVARMDEEKKHLFHTETHSWIWRSTGLNIGSAIPHSVECHIPDRVRWQLNVFFWKYYFFS